jgi:3-hydroxyacyl-CoA dehydrogenase
MQYEVAAKNVCVIGAGTMGSGIAAHLANLGFQVTLLDATQTSVVDAFERARNARPPHFYTPERANEVRLGNTTEHLHYVAEAQWVIEAIVEQADAKRALYAQIDSILAPDAMISTNTSGLEISMLAEGRSESFRRRFLGTHFFNPPRYLKLLELIPTPETDPDVVLAMTRFLEEKVARRVVLAKDTPGFIANRYGMWCMFHAIHVAERLHLSIEEVDAITGPFLGRPKSGSFRLNDIVGLDVMRDIASNLLARCSHDPQVGVLNAPNSMIQLLARGWIGDKSGHGYYRREGGELLALDLGTFAYRMRRDVAFPSLASLESLPLGERLARALDLRDQVGEFLRLYLVPALRYAHQLREEVSHSVLDFDRVMQWGFGWQMGPFAMIDAIGPEKLGIEAKRNYVDGQQLTFAGTYAPLPKEPEYASIADYPIVSQAESYVLRDLGDGVSAVSLRTKMGVITPVLVEELSALLERNDLSRFVLTSETRAFSVGFDLRFFLAAINEERWQDVDLVLQRLQRLGTLLEKRTVVAAVHGYCLGAGLELAMSCSHIVALAECQIGLPEARVGLLPGGRGTVLMRLYNQHNARRLTEVAVTLANGTIAPNADQARVLGYLRPADFTVYHPDRLITDAKRVALASNPVARPAWNTIPGPLVGMIDRELDAATRRGEITEYDSVIGHKIKQIFARSANYEAAITRERVEFLDLCDNALTFARIRHMVETNKPLRN